MAQEQANPSAGAEQAAAVDPLTRLGAFLDREGQDDQAEDGDGAAPGVEARTDAAPQPDGPAATDELTPEDLPDETPPAAAPLADAFEIVHEGKQHKLSREETIRYAQQGFDYTQKTMALAEQSREVEQRLSRIAQIEQVNPQLESARAQLMALEAQLRPYEGADWVALATNDPLEYSKVRAQYDVLLRSYQGAAGQFNQMRNAIEQQRTAIHQDILRAESQKLTQRIPQWQDPEKFKAGSQELRSWLVSEGATTDEVNSLTSSLAVSIAFRAMRYDQLQKAKAGKVKELRTAPPVTRPGAVQTSGSAQADKTQALHQRLRKSGDVRDAAGLIEGLLK